MKQQETHYRLTLIICIFCIILSAVVPTWASQTEVSGKDAGAEDMQSETQEQLEKELGAFEITAEQRELAKENKAGYPMLDAGRGNPNWINTQSRYAFTRFMNYAVGECERTYHEGSMAGAASIEGIGERFDEAMDPSDPTDAFLIESVKYCVEKLGLDKDALLKELTDAVVGDYYPSPSRCLPNTESILNAYLQSVLYSGADLAGETKIFPTEGGSAAMVYIFEALSHNRILKPGDHIAIATPIFTPYMQIPSVRDYGLVSINVESSEEDSWEISAEEIKKLEDPSIKAFFLVNPSNPASHALSDETLKNLKEVVDKNPDLIILTDDVYGTFVNDFKSVYSVIPYNTVLIYSFSKLYGVTGWRVGLIAMHNENVVDHLLENLPAEDKSYLFDEYSIVTTEPEEMAFLDRVVADSRSIGLYHTSGLSTPSQVFMDFLALTHLVYETEDPYIRIANETVHGRYEALMKGLGLPVDDSSLNARYYVVVNIYSLAEQRYGKEFAEWMKKEKSDIEFLYDFAKEKGVVLMYGYGFSAPEGTVRISLANLNKEDYEEIAKRFFELLEEYHAACEHDMEQAPIQ